MPAILPGVRGLPRAHGAFAVAALVAVAAHLAGAVASAQDPAGDQEPHLAATAEEGETPEPEGPAPHLCAKYAPPPVPADVLERVMREGQLLDVVPAVREPDSALSPADTADDGAVVEVRALVWFDAPVKQVWRVLRDYAAYSKWVPRIRRSELISDRGGAAEPLLEIDMPWPFRDLVTHTRNHHVECSADRPLSWWTLVGGNLTENRGVVTLYAGPGGGTLLRQRTVLGMRAALRGDYARRGLTRYFGYVLSALREQVGRASRGGWYSLDGAY